MKGEDNPKYCGPTPETISQSMDHVVLDTRFPETGNRDRDKLKNHMYWEEWKAYEFPQLDDMDKDNMFVSLCRILSGDIILKKIWTYVIKNYGKQSQ